jgi:hypothetical protein
MLARWTQNGSIVQVGIDGADQALDLFDRLNSELADAPSMIEFVAPDDRGPAFAIGAGRAVSVLTFQASLDPPYFISSGDLDANGELWFSFAEEETAYAKINAIDRAVARTALRQFIETCDLPDNVSWERL